ncbi:MAG: polymer-forming cytoskeletal protein [Alphaproteobacteria bacterium]|nr:polymer-forming cytoskeletal protein [Alphaproteobacteria bacterium]
MSQPATKSVIMADTVIEGDVVSKGQVVVNGRVQGSLSAQSVEVSPSGGIYGSLRAKTADVNGTVQGDIAIGGLIQIGQTGSVEGEVEYGKISMQQGGALSGTMRNVPPQLTGDFKVSVERGGKVRITTLDLTAFDPDDDAKDLTYSLSNPKGGFIALASADTVPVQKFTQADIERGAVFFVHDGTNAPTAGFDTIVTDAKGETSGKQRHVTVEVKG